MKRKAIVVLVIVIIIVGMLGYIFLSGSHQNQTSSSTSTAVSPAIPIKDYAPNLPARQKTTILIQTSDSSDIKYIVPTDQVDTYVKSLPEGYKVMSKTP